MATIAPNPTAPVRRNPVPPSVVGRPGVTFQRLPPVSTAHTAKRGEPRKSRRVLFLKLLLVLVGLNGFAALLGIFIGFEALWRTFATTANLLVVVLVALCLSGLVNRPRLAFAGYAALALCALEVVLVFVGIWFEVESEFLGQLWLTTLTLIVLAVVGAFLERRNDGSASVTAAVAVSFLSALVFAILLLLLIWEAVESVDEGTLGKMFAALGIIMVTSALMALILKRIHLRAGGLLTT